MNNPIKSADQIISTAVELAKTDRKRRVAVAAAQDGDVISAVAQAYSDDFINGTLVGDKEKIESLANEKSIDIKGLDIIDEKDPIKAAHSAVKLASEKEADIIMKGFLPTSALLKVVLNKQYNLRGKNTLSHCAVLDIPGYHKLLNLTDGGMVVKPDQTQKYQILENGVQVCKALNLSPVKIAVSGAFDKPMSEMTSTISDMDHLIPEAAKNFEDIQIHGPLPFDMATSKEAADAYGRTGSVLGDADIYLVDSIEECNIVSKSMIQFVEAIFAGVIVGAKVPVSLVSRSDTVKNKKTSLALACLLSNYYENEGGAK